MPCNINRLFLLMLMNSLVRWTSQSASTIAVMDYNVCFISLKVVNVLADSSNCVNIGNRIVEIERILMLFAQVTSSGSWGTGFPAAVGFVGNYNVNIICCCVMRYFWFCIC